MAQQYLPNTVQVAVCVGWAIIVDHDINTLDVNASAKNVSSHEDSLFKCLERSVPINTGSSTSATKAAKKW
jgi:hypothetical protein